MQTRSAGIRVQWMVVMLAAMVLIFGTQYASAQEATIAGIADEISPVDATGSYYVQRNAEQAIRDLNDLHQLGLTDARITELSEKLRNDVYPRYPGTISDLKAYLMDVNDSLGLDLSEAQVDVQIQEMNRLRSPEETEIPLRFSGTPKEVIDRVPSDESAPYFTLKNQLLLFFVDNSNTGNAWTSAQMTSARGKVSESINWFKAKDTSDVITELNYRYFGTVSNVAFTNSCNNTWMDQCAQDKGYADLEACMRNEMTTYGVDHIVTLFLISEDDRAQACPYLPEWGGGYGHWDERCIIFSYNSLGPSIALADAGVYKHETLHLYGDCDEYRSSECNTGCEECLVSYPTYRPLYLNENNCEYCTDTPVTCVMRSGAHGSAQNNAICYWSMGQIGWPVIDCSISMLSSDKTVINGLHKFRDDLLSANETGRRITHIYYHRSPEVAGILAKRPMLAIRGAALLKQVMPGIQFLLKGSDGKVLRRGSDGKDIVMSRLLITRAQKLFTDIGAEGSDALADALAELSYMLDDLKGMRISRAWRSWNKE